MRVPALVSLLFTIATLWFSLVLWKRHKTHQSTVFMASCGLAAFLTISEQAFFMLLIVPTIGDKMMILFRDYYDPLVTTLTIVTTLSTFAWTVAAVAFLIIGLRFKSSQGDHPTPSGEISDAPT